MDVTNGQVIITEMLYLYDIKRLNMDNPLNIMIIEDEALISSMMEMQVEILGHHIVASVSDSGAALEALDHHTVDIALMDININGTYDGVELADMIRSKQDVAVIFVTSNHDDMSFRRASRTNPAAFVTKPFTDIQLQRTISLVANKIVEEKNKEETSGQSLIEEGTLFVRKNQVLQKIAIADIYYLESDGRYCRVYTRSEMLLTNSTLKDMMERLPKDIFLQCHRRYVINISKVKSINLEEDLIIMEERSVPVSRREKDKILSKINFI